MDWFNEFFGQYEMQFVYLVRVLFAGVCGLALGWERMLREKEAGIRTHLILAVGACLITCVSLSFENDSSRIAAQIVSGIGFIGAGMIMFRGEALHGLTTAAGVWTTAGIGMACGNGMYILALCVTMLVILCQVILHNRLNYRLVHAYKYIKVEFINTQENIDFVKTFFEVKSFNRLKVYVKNEQMLINAVIRTSSDCSVERLAQIMSENKSIISLERLDGRNY